jgi:site-specific DNA-methyltransferase (adenine-specific)
MQYELHCGNSKELLKTLEDNSIDSIATDPPYELGFMGKKWDASGIAYDVELWHECLRVLKPGGHLLAFSGSRTYHRMTVAIEDAGFEIRDQIMWIYGSGFPKSHNVGKQENCEEWNGWGTALKPAHEPICVARKPLIGTVAENVLTHGTGAINVDACRVETNEYLGGGSMDVGSYTNWNVKQGARPQTSEWKGNTRQFEQPTGRWPANIIHDGSAEVLAGFPETQSSYRPNSKGKIYSKNLSYFTNKTNNAMQNEGQNDKGSAARFFYCAKASKKDRDEGLEGFEERERPTMGNGIGGQPNQQMQNNRNHHPTVKPTNLMQYLCRLVTPKNGLILDPFLGSGSTGKAAIYEGFRFIGFDLNQEYIDIAKARIEYAIKMNNESSGKKENTLFEDEE